MSEPSVEIKPTKQFPMKREMPEGGGDGGGELTDLMGGAARHHIQIGEHGFLALLDVMPRLVPEGQTADASIVQAARVSYGAGTKRVSEDRGLIRYLLRHRHTTPFEMVEFKFHCSMPIFIARQWIRHRTANVNEYSGRYSVMPERFYRPGLEDISAQSATNRQGRAEAVEVETAEEFLEYLDRAQALHKDYLELTEKKGLSRELGRIGLPLSLYTEWYWKCDLHNILRFIGLRMDAHAQHEIQLYARAMYQLIEPMVPWTCEAFRDYEIESVNLTRLEVQAIRAGSAELDTSNKREQAEWTAKRDSLGLGSD